MKYAMGNFLNCRVGVQGGKLAVILPHFVPQGKCGGKNTKSDLQVPYTFIFKL